MACELYLNKAIKRKDKGRERGGLEELEVWLKGNVLRDRNKMCIFSVPENTTDKRSWCVKIMERMLNDN